MNPLQAPTSSDLSPVITAFLEGHRPDQNVAKILTTISGLAPRIATRDLVKRGLLEDVVSRTVELLLRRPAGHFDSSRGTGETYLATLVRTAVRDVRAESQWAIGHRRDYSEVTVEIIDDEETCELESDVALLTHLNDRLNGAPGLVVGASLIAIDDFSVVSAAAAVGLSRHQLVRGLHRALRPTDLAA